MPLPKTRSRRRSVEVKPLRTPPSSTKKPRLHVLRPTSSSKLLLTNSTLLESLALREEKPRPQKLKMPRLRPRWPASVPAIPRTSERNYRALELKKLKFPPSPPSPQLARASLLPTLTGKRGALALSKLLPTVALKASSQSSISTITMAREPVDAQKKTTPAVILVRDLKDLAAFPLPDVPSRPSRRSPSL